MIAATAFIALLAAAAPLANANAGAGDTPPNDDGPPALGADYEMGPPGEDAPLTDDYDAAGVTDSTEGDTAADAPEPEADEPSADTPVETSEMWEQCLVQLQGSANATHSLVDIVTGAFEERNQMEPSVFVPLVEEVDTETMAILTSFNLTGEGYTLILPLNMAKNFSSEVMEEVPVFELYDFDANNTSAENITEVIRAHIIPGTLTFTKINNALKNNDTYAVESLQGYTWVFALEGGNSTDSDSEGFPVLLDQHNITTTGYFNIQADISNAPNGQCPNTMIVSTDGFFAAPQYLEFAEAPAPAPAPTPAPEPIVALPAAAPIDAGAATPPESAPAPASGAFGTAGGSVLAATVTAAAALLLALV